MTVKELIEKIKKERGENFYIKLVTAGLINNMWYYGDWEKLFHPEKLTPYSMAVVALDASVEEYKVEYLENYNIDFEVTAYTRHYRR